MALNIYPKLAILNGYAAKMACTCKFLIGRNENRIKNEDLYFFPVNKTTISYDTKNKFARASLLGLEPMYAVFRGDIGCTLTGMEYQSLPEIQIDKSHIVSFEWPNSTAEYNEDLLSNTFDWAFQEKLRTRAVVVIKDGQLVREQYAEDITRNTPLLGWSMTKSITNALYGILVHDGKLQVNDTTNFKPWQEDMRKQITYDQLLKMNSGLQWTEDYGIVSDVTRMLYLENMPTRYAISKKLDSKPGSAWEYSSGTTNILSHLLKLKLQNEKTYIQFAQNRLFNKLGIGSACIEMDAQNNQILSSYAWMNARDWAKLGQLYLQNGIWNNERLFPQDWISYSTTVANNSFGEYGAQIWLNKDYNTFTSLSEDLYYFSGYQGQRVFIVPEKKLVFVRLGLTDKDVFDMEKFATGIINAF